MRGDYERLVEIKQALAMEIAVYKNIIEGEEKRIRKWDVGVLLVTSFNYYFSRVSRKFSSRMTDQSNYESMSDSDAERRFKSVDEIDGRSVHVESRHQSRTVRSSKSTKYWLIFIIVLHLYFSFDNDLSFLILWNIFYQAVFVQLSLISDSPDLGSHYPWAVL